MEEERLKILGDARGREIQIAGSAHAADKDFYRFSQTLQAYEKAFGDNAVFILSDKNDLLQYVTSPGSN